VRVDPDGLQYSSPPIEGLVLIESPHSLLVLCQPLLQSSSCLAYIDMVTVMAGNLVDHSSLLLLRHSVLHISKAVSIPSIVHSARDLHEVGYLWLGPSPSSSIEKEGSHVEVTVKQQ